MFNVNVIYQTLSQYLSEVRELIQEYTDHRWIVAEIAKVDIDKTGHYWFELVEKKDNEIVAQAGAVLWKSNIDTIYNFFLKTGIELQKGIKILFLGKATFHEKYGFKLNILQIDPAFTLGEMALKKKEVIERLTREGLIDRNKSIQMPVVIQRIAVISSETAAGYEDFLKILKANKYGYKFYIKLFDVFVQGENAVASIINALQNCASDRENYDAVVVIRGGGSAVDLSCFNDYELARKIALMPIPVLTGIGHTRDETVADCVACRSFKTPSEVAKFILDGVLDFDLKIDYLRKMILHRVNFSLSSQKQRIFSLKHNLHKNTIHRIKKEEVNLNSLNHKIKLKCSEYLAEVNFRIKSYKEKIKSRLQSILAIKALHIDRFSEKLHLLSPENILKRGYSIAYFNGRILKNSMDVEVGQNIQVKLYKGKVTGKVTEREEENGQPQLF
uniref:Exodeoxyribonuclease 7 large subunit n=1 Tax=Thermodesulfovibrio aggregans TaxID=86166 RepID=A0A7C4AK77_9BACT